MNNIKKIKVLFLAVEVAPLAKVGGLGDVAGALPKALNNLDVDIRICLPFFGLIDKKKYPVIKIKSNVKIEIDNVVEKVGIWQTKLPGSAVPVYLIKHKYFNAKNIYSGAGVTKKGSKNTDIDTKRFAFFTKAAVAAARALKFQPDIIHAQDWMTAMSGDIIKTENKVDNFFQNTRVLYTIHNLANQGIAQPDIIGYTKIDSNLPIIKADAKNGDINFMVQGILGSDIINTVSPRYSREILQHYQGAGLDQILRQRQKDLYGILNGIDIDFFNPATDPQISRNYDIKSVELKKINKLTLQKNLRLPLDEKKCVVGLISRLVWQKGIELITEDFSNLDCQFVILGTGHKEYEDYLKKLAKKFPRQFCVKIMFDLKLAQQIYAGSDIFLVPSRFEPCGLTQMIAMRYGAVPVVRATGGLADTVIDCKMQNAKCKMSTGFVFKRFNFESLEKILKRALKIYYQQPKIWRKLQINGMKKDFSWQQSARQYVQLYKKLL